MANNNTNNLALRSILDKDKLNETNFVDWQRNLSIVLRMDEKEYVLEKPIPPAPPANAPKAVKDAYEKHVKDGNQVSFVMLATMITELQKQYEDMKAYEMIVALQQLYQGQSRHERFLVSKALFSCKFSSGNPVGPHVLKMIGYITNLEKLGFSLQKELATDLILQSLPELYKGFVMNYMMHDLDKPLPELLKMLQTAEENLTKGKGASVLMREERFLGSADYTFSGELQDVFIGSTSGKECVSLHRLPNEVCHWNFDSPIQAYDPPSSLDPLPLALPSVLSPNALEFVPSNPTTTNLTALKESNISFRGCSLSDTERDNNWSTSKAYDSDFEHMGYANKKPTAVNAPPLKPMFKGCPLVSFSKKDVDNLSQKFRDALVGRFRRRPPMSVIKTFLARLGFGGGFTVAELTTHNVLINFELDQDYQHLFYRQSWTLGAETMVVTKWSPNLRPEEDSPIVPVWITIPNLPIHLHDQQALFNITSLLGKPLKVDSATLNFSRPKAARVCLEVDVSIPLHSKIHVRHVEEDLFFQVIYEEPPAFCSICRKLGHDCKKKAPADPPENASVKKPEFSRKAMAEDKQETWWTLVQRGGKSSGIQSKKWVPKPNEQPKSPDSVANNKIWFFWDKSVYSLSNSKDYGQICHFLLHDINMDNDFIISCVYGGHSTSARKQLWNVIVSLHSNNVLPWCLGGDFNTISNLLHHKGSRLPDLEGVCDFSDCIKDCNLNEPTFTGPSFTWHGVRSNGNVWKRLDRVFFNDVWDTKWPKTSLTHMAKNGSDHCPLLFTSQIRDTHTSKAFKFQNMWLLKEEFMDYCKKSWEEVPFHGGMKSLFTRLHHLKGKLSAWNKTSFGNVFDMLKEAEDEATRAEILFHTNPTTTNKILLNQKQAVLADVSNREYHFWKQKCSLKWFKEGDANTKFFHGLRMSQAAGNVGQAVLEGEPEHMSVHTEASSFTPQQAPEQAALGAGPVPKAAPIIHPQFAANFMNFLQQMSGAYREEFLKFTQGELTLPEYRQKFDELTGFWQDLVPTVEKQCKRFVEGLRPDLSAHLTIAPQGDINALYKNALDLNVALIKKAEYEQSQEGSTAPSRPPPSQKAGTSNKRSIAAPSTSHQSKKVKSAPTQSSAPVQKKGKSGDGYRYPICNLCGRRNPGECWFTQGLCLGQPKRQASGGQAGKAPARTYVMQGRTEQPAHDVIMGMFTLFNTSITALIDPGSTLSYVCMPMPVVPNIPREDLDNPVIVSNPLGHNLRLTHVYHNCPLVVQGKTFPASLIELPHREFDVILGMDWLTANQAVIDCGAHTVRLRAEDGSDILIRGELLPKAPEFISYIHARRLIHKKCEAFLCTVRDTRQEAPRREDIPIPTLRQQIASTQSSDDFCIHTIELVSRGEKLDFTVQDGILYYRERMVVPAGEHLAELSKIHNVFHVSMLRRYRSDPSHVIPADTVTLDENLTYEVEPVEILAREVRQLRNKTIPLVKVLWRSHTVEEATWET
ncbi:unnamed protein product [Cuscuta campestris]|uniref:Uncharacterized protein n=2 Tax=Cuscuta campestris TaxID=132261 RepID=A0A484LB40_9ASTE|nr:unnamed protein product [Cuscuta campestris]